MVQGLLYSQRIVPDVYISCFQYKILNRLLNCNHNLYKWKKSDTPLCCYCDSIDTIQHHLFECSVSEAFWKRVCAWLRSVMCIDFLYEFTECEILFGYNIFETKYSAVNHIQNIVILVGKWYLNKNRSDHQYICFNQFLCILKRKIDIYVKIYTSKIDLKRPNYELQIGLKTILKKF